MSNNELQDFKLIGLNKKTKAGIYCTVEYGNEDWFHADIDERWMPIDRQNALFDYAKGTDNFWKQEHSVAVQFDGFSSSGKPINPIIKTININKSKETII